MIVSQKQREPSRLAKLLSWISPDGKPLESHIFSEEQFRNEMQKEKSRVDRRTVNTEFAVVLIDGLSRTQISVDKALVARFTERLRITDCMGWCENRLGFLLPETGRGGAEIVANDLHMIAAESDLKTSFEILIYPDDDGIANSCNEFHDFQFTTDSADSRFEDTVIDSRPIQFGAISETNRNTFFRETPPMPFWKRAIDATGALAGLVMLSPVFALAAIAVRFSGPGPVFFRQSREGKDGRPFEMLKFRTMCVDADKIKHKLKEFSEQDGPAFKIEKDPRLTVVGKYLRKSCIDELPQLLNVLRGEMSLVGPRPLPVSESIECLIWQRKRLEVAPGLTCIWQVRGDRKTKFADWMRMDMEYIRKRSFWLDVKLIFQTIWVAVLHRGSV